MKWIDRQSVKKGNTTEMSENLIKICFTGTRICYYI